MITNSASSPSGRATMVLYGAMRLRAVPILKP